MSSRDDILARVRKNQPAPQPLPAVPTFGTDLGSAQECFISGSGIRSKVLSGNFNIDIAISICPEFILQAE